MKEVLFYVCLATLLWSGTVANSEGKSRVINLFEVPEPNLNPSIIDAADQCMPVQNCDPNARYRTFSGSCNNLRFPMWGQAQAALTRLTEGVYNDGVSEPRKAASGIELPNPREIVVEAFSFEEKVDHDKTLLLMTWGQLMSHDASVISPPADPPETCCTEGGPDCLNIPVSPTDPFYKRFNVTCLPMIRAATTQSLGCSLKPVYTMTGVSQFMDASFVYGSSDEQAGSLRQKRFGLLREELISEISFPPHAVEKLCFGQTNSSFCLETGDDRANQNPPLTVLQVIFFREHNRIAVELRKLNPSWDDEKLYQESRRILIAEYQIIGYRDWLPQIIGAESAVAAKLIPNLDSMNDDYDEFLNPSTTTDFTSAAYRVFHSQIPSAYCAEGSHDRATGCPFGANKFSNSFDHPQLVSSPEGFQSVLFGLEHQNVDKTDESFTIEISGRLFRRNRPWGHDLIATDIARGRDVGLAPYNKYRSLCGLRPAKVWPQLLDVFPPRVLQKLRKLYEVPDDIDLYVGGVLENKFGKSLVGPIFQCLIVDQFKRWMKGDRYFVDFKGFSHSFTKDQVKALKSTSLARLFCDNGGPTNDMPRDVFRLKSERVPCENIPRVDLSPWKESTS